MKSYSTQDEALDAMTSALGVALANWQSVEVTLFFLYIELCDKTAQKIRDAIFGAMSLDTKMRVLASLIKARTSDQKYMRDWDGVHKKFSKQKRLRDKLAHWTIMQSQLDQSGNKFVAFLAPPVSNIARMLRALENPENSEAISAEVLLKKSLDEFGEVNKKIDAFRQSLPSGA
jgi:hypothetical protein